MADKAFEKARKAQPKRKEVRLPMVADSSAETAIDVPTGIGDDDHVGWMILGMDWFFETIASPYPRVDPYTAGVGDAVCMLQLCKGEKPATPVLLRGGDNDLLLEDILIFTQATGVGFGTQTFPRKPRKTCFTRHDNVHLMFQTSVDLTDISLTTIQIYAEILYVPMETADKRSDDV